MNPNESKIPAGILDNNIEFFADNGRIVFLQHGALHGFDELDTFSAAKLREEMDLREEVHQSLLEMGILNPIQQLKQYISCNYGGFDSRADISENGISYKEYWDCGQRGQCKWEGRLCNAIKAINGVLTLREIQVIKLVAQDLADKEIADKLQISIHTVAIHRSHIEHKIGAHSKIGIAVFAKDFNIV